MPLLIRESLTPDALLNSPTPETMSLTYWQAVRKDFARNRTAFCAALVIGFVALLSILCPLIANNRPLYAKAVFQDDFLNSLQITIEQIGKLAAPKTIDGLEREKANVLIEENFARMNDALGPTERVQMRAIISDYRAASSSADVIQLRVVLQKLDPFFDVKPSATVRYPALRALRNLEVYLLLSVIVSPIVLIVGRRKPLTMRLLVLLLLPLLGTIAWKSAYPTVQDSVNYRRIDGTSVRTLIPYGENENILADARQPPTWVMETAKRTNWHWLGTDTNGRDVLTRMVYGTRVSMVVSIVAVGIYTIIGMILGSAAGYFRGWTDIIISRLTEVVICFPPLMVILSVQAFLKPSIVNIVITLAALWWTGVQRLQRGEFLRVVNLDYVQAVRALGGSHLRIITMHILPNAMGPILVMTSFGIAGAILIESALSFLGFGVPQPMASWGDLLNNGRNDINGTWWLTVFPGFAIFLTVTCFNVVGEGFRDALDPRRQR